MRVVLAMIVAILSGCGSAYSSLQAESSSKQTIYELTEEQAFQVAFGAITQVFPGYEVTDVDGPVKGYTTTFRFVLDTYTQQVMVIPATGKAPNGRLVEGYYFDVSGRGSSVVQGRAKNAELFETVIKSADATSRAVPVSNVARASYSGARWKQGELSQGKRATDGDAFLQIQRLKQLRDSGAITEDEFERKRKQLLERI